MYDHILLELPTLPSGVQLPDVVEDASAQEASEVLAPLRGLLDSAGGHATAAELVASGAPPARAPLTALHWACSACAARGAALGAVPPAGTTARGSCTRALETRTSGCSPALRKHHRPTMYTRLLKTNSGIQDGHAPPRASSSCSSCTRPGPRAVENLHRRLRDSVDIMGVGVGLPRADHIAEEGAAAVAPPSAGTKDVGDVRRAARTAHRPRPALGKAPRVPALSVP